MGHCDHLFNLRFTSPQSIDTEIVQDKQYIRSCRINSRKRPKVEPTFFIRPAVLIRSARRLGHDDPENSH